MLKGLMKIALTDIHTGKTETMLEQNMVTNALANIFKPMGIDKSSGKMLNGMNPYYHTVLGGLLLFDSQIAENADNLYPPSEVNLIGCASYGVQNNTTGTLRGRFNQTESELNMTILPPRRRMVQLPVSALRIRTADTVLTSVRILPLGITMDLVCRSVTDNYSMFIITAQERQQGISIQE